MTIEFEDIKKSKSNYFSWFLVLLSLAILCGVCYKRGIGTVRSEAISLGYAEQTKDGYAWNSARKIGKGIK